MDLKNGTTYDLYRDIQKRCNGEIYIGVVGPVRTGKSTCIKRFMDLLVLPNISDENEKIRTTDELPQSGAGKTITTTEPKFIPKEGVSVHLTEDVDIKVRLIDCVGYMVEGAGGHMEGDSERLVKTPWFEQAIPFSQAAELGTRKVITDHSTIGIVVLSDGSFTDLEKDAYMEAGKRAILELKALKKPFVVLVNTTRPYGEDALEFARNISETYKVNAFPVNCAQLKKEDINEILRKVLYAFPISKICFHSPKWVELLDCNHELKRGLCQRIASFVENLECMEDVLRKEELSPCDYIKACKIDKINMADGCISMRLDVEDSVYFTMLSEILGEEVDSEWKLLAVLKELGRRKKEYEKVEDAMEAVRNKGYGVIIPEKDEISLQQPEVIHHGNKCGIKITAHSPSIHLIKADIESEISPIVGSEAQAEDLIRFIGNGEENGGMWETNIFGKTIEHLVRDGID